MPYKCVFHAIFVYQFALLQHLIVLRLIVFACNEHHIRFDFDMTKLFAVFADFQPSTKLYTRINLHWALVQWQNMAVQGYKNTEITKIQNPRKFHPTRIKAYTVWVLVCIQ